MILLERISFSRLALSVLAILLSTGAPGLSSAASDPIQTISGEVSAKGIHVEKVGEEEVDWKNSWSGQTYGYVGGNRAFSFSMEGNSICLKYNEFLDNSSLYNQGIDLVIPTQSQLENAWTKVGCVYFDEKGNYLSNNVKMYWPAGTSFSEGKGNSSMAGYSELKVKSAGITSCSFNCNQANKYNYTVKYETTAQGTTTTINPASAHKCDAVKAKITPQAEWFGSLTHSCSYQGGNERIFTIDFPSPPTNILVCANRASCLSQSKEYKLPDFTFGRGAQKVPANFVLNAEKSLAGSDATIKCINGVCTPYGSGPKRLTVNIPETTYYGQCRGSATSETVEGKTITSPAVTINTEEAKIPAATSTLDINVANRPPISTVTFEKKYLSEGETTKVYCDVIDPDDCSDKIVKIKWKCMDSQGKTDNCFFVDNGVFKQGEMFKEIAPANPYRDIVDLKLNKKETYAVTCEAWDNDNANTLSGAGINSIKVTDPVCIKDGICNPNCPYDPDCCDDPKYVATHPQCEETCVADGICNPNCPYDPDCCDDPAYASTHPECGGVIPNGSCFITRIKPPFDIKKIKPKTKVTFEAKIFGGTNPSKYTWFCDKDDPASQEMISTEKTVNHTCTNYILDNHTYEPKVLVTYPNGETKECKNNEGTAVTTDGIASDKIGFCLIVPAEGGSENSVCGDKTTAKFKIHTNYEFENPTYKWTNCPGATNEPTATCEYSTSQLSEKFTPELTIEDDGETIKCPSSTSVTLYRKSSCEVLSRVKGSGEDYTKTPSSRVGDTLELKVEGKCVDPKNNTTWTVTGAQTPTGNDDKASTLLTAAGTVIIKAKVKVGDQLIDCEESSTDVKQKIQEGV